MARRNQSQLSQIFKRLIGNQTLKQLSALDLPAGKAYTSVGAGLPFVSRPAMLSRSFQRRMKSARSRRTLLERLEPRVVFAVDFDLNSIVSPQWLGDWNPHDEYGQFGQDHGSHAQLRDSVGSHSPNDGTFKLGNLETHIIRGAAHQFTWDDSPAEGMSPVPTMAASSAASSPLTSIPVLNSRLGAAASLYLDFNGHFESAWGSYSNITTPVYDFDGDGQTFSDAELANITAVWERVAEDYAPFNINVTTVEPPELAPGTPSANANQKALRIAIGGKSSDWYPTNVGGVGYINAFTSSIPNVAYVFAANQSTPEWLALTISHEAGHSFGLQHQSRYDANGVLVSTYNGGDQNWAPLMGSLSYTTAVTTWHNGPSSLGATSLQDDLAILANATNAFGYRVDDRGNTTGSSTALSQSGNSWSGAGLVGTNADVDMFSFTIASEDTYQIAVGGDRSISNLDAAIELRNASGSLLEASSPLDSTSAKIVRNLTPGNYFLAVTKSASYGWLGSYSIAIDAPPAAISVVTTSGSSLATSEDGRQASFLVTLQTQPTSDVNIPISSSNTSEGTLSVSSLLFTAANWNVPQLVTLTGVADESIDSDAPYMVKFGLAISSDPEYSGLARPDLPVVNLDINSPGYLYSVDYLNGTINRARFSGLQPEVIVDLKSLYGPAFRAKQIAIDEAGEKIYWVMSDIATSTAIQRANLDGSNIENLVSVPYQSGGYRGITLDLAGGKMYWIDNTNQNGKIQRANLDGSNIENVYVSSGSDFWAMSLALDTTAGKVYWTDFGVGASNAIRRANLDGSNVEVVWTSVESRAPTGFGLDLSAGKMYWADLSQDLIRRANLDGSNVEVLIDTAALVQGSSVLGLALDLAAGRMFWTDDKSNTIYRANLDGSMIAPVGSGSGLEGVAVAHLSVWTPGITLSRKSGLVTSEAGASEALQISLKTKPTADVTIPISSSNLSEGTVSAASVTFTPNNWYQAQTVTITGVNDAFVDGDVQYMLVLGAASSTDPNYSGMDSSDVSLTNRDDDFYTSTFTKNQNSSIPDPGTLNSSLAVSSSAVIQDLNVVVNISHSWDEDLDVFLIAPDGTRIELFTDVGGSANHFTNTVLDDEATTSIAAGTAPFTGTFKPEGNLTLLEGKNLLGTWILEVTDDSAADKGTLVSWSIIARHGAPLPTVLVTPTAGLATTENGGAASFTVRLDTLPNADVTIPLNTSDATEGTISTNSLTFTPTNWNVPQTVTVTGVDDALVDGDVAYKILLGSTMSADPRFQGLKPASVSVSNTDNDLPPTKFYVVNDGSPDRTYEYGATGTSIENYTINSGNTAPRGAASNAAGDTVWVADKNRKVYVYNTSGGLLGSWSAGTLTSTALVEGVATHGSDVWIVDSKSDKVYRYTGAASRTSGSQNAASSFSLNSSNTSPKGIVTDGTYLWVVNSSTSDKVFKYTLSGSLVGSWTIDSANKSPTGLTIDPTGVSQSIWIVDSGTDKVYEYTSARGRTSGSQSAANTFALAAGNSNPQGIADPPAAGSAENSTQLRIVPNAPQLAPPVDGNQTKSTKSMIADAAQATSLIGSDTTTVPIDPHREDWHSLLTARGQSERSPASARNESTEPYFLDGSFDEFNDVLLSLLAHK